MGFGECVNEILKRPDIQINYVDESGKTALMWAVERGHLKVVEYLLEHPLLDVNIKAIAQEWVLNLKAISQEWVLEKNKNPPSPPRK